MRLERKVIKIKTFTADTLSEIQMGVNDFICNKDGVRISDIRCNQYGDFFCYVEY